MRLKSISSRERLARWRRANREHVRAYFAAWRTRHREELKAYHANWYRKNRDEQLAKCALRYTARREEILEQKRKYLADNGDRINAVRRARRAGEPERVRKLEKLWRERNPEKKLAKDSAYRHKYPDRIKASTEAAKKKKPELYRLLNVQRSNRRRSRVRLAPTEPVSIKAIIERDRSICHLCSKRVQSGNLSIDHLIPVIRGGAFAVWNLCVAHRACNYRRGTKRILTEETREAAEIYIQGRLHEHDRSRQERSQANYA